MSLDNIQLPAIVIHDLFKNSLIDLNTKQPVTVSSATATFAYLGNNQKKVIVIVNDDSAIYLSDISLNFLLGILAACHLTMADIALINMAQNKDLVYTQISEKINAEKIILFGLGPGALKLPLEFPHYQLQSYNNQVYLSAPDLGILNTDRAEKTKLWGCLKQLFLLS
jgi:hypothetical protein